MISNGSIDGHVEMRLKDKSELIPSFLKTKGLFNQVSGFFKNRIILAYNKLQLFHRYRNQEHCACE